MGIVRSIRKEDRDEHQCGETKQQKHNGGMLVAAVVDLHAGYHHRDACNGPRKLPNYERVGGIKALFRHYRRSAEYHHQSNKYQKQGYGKQPAIDTDTLRHYL